ncbi:tRNA lysidine(34) synthetase TilS [bacterium SCSIO 12696]|nr:tRNA lysidine(34) synthetase TilS [bacterium SCSIO 12696]
MVTSDLLASDLPTLQNAERVYVGYSGGLDSQTLLHAVVAVLGAEKVTALHINHQISANADAWQAHCAEQCRQLGVQLQAFRVNLDSNENTELAARNARYQVFESALRTNELLLLAHHADDQAETVLYRLMRGAGPRGLAGIPRSRPLGKGQLLRPLLDISRQDIQRYAQSHNLNWVEDESNQQLDYDRNYLRHQVLPALETRWPDATKRLGQVSTLCHDTDQLNQRLAAIDLDVAEVRRERFGVSIQQSVLANMDIARRHNLIRYWCEQSGYSLPAKTRLESIHSNLLDAQQDASPIIDFGDCQLHRYNQRIYLLPPLPAPPAIGTEINWDGNQPLHIEGCGKLFAAKPFAKPVIVRFRQGGERCQPQGRNSSQTLKKLLQEYHLEPWLRQRVPLIYNTTGQEIIAVAGLFTSTGWPCFDWQVA